MRLATLIRTLAALLLVAVVLKLLGCVSFSPAVAADVLVPLDGVSARIEVWNTTFPGGGYYVAVTNSFGTERRFVWQDWGPAQRASLYLTEDRRLVVIGGGGITEMIAAPVQTKPRWIPYEKRSKREDGSDWRYIGAVDRGRDGLIFYPPARQKECVPLYGKGSSPYRKVHQDNHSCQAAGY